MVDIDTVVWNSKLRLIQHFGRKHPLSPGIFRTDIAKQFRNAQITKSELGRARVGGIQLVSRTKGENICGVDVLVSVAI